MLRWRTDGFHLWVCAISVALWLAWTFSIPLDDFFSFLLPFGLFALAALFLGSWAWSVVHGVRQKAWLPFVITCATAALLVAVPWPELYVKANFRLMLASRMEIVRRVQADDYWENRDDVRVCRATPSGHDSGKPYPVVFYLSRGFLSHFDALVWVPQEISVSTLAEGPCLRVKQRAIRPWGSQNPGWYLVSD